MIDLNNALTYKSKTKNVKARTIKGYQVNGKEFLAHCIWKQKHKIDFLYYNYRINNFLSPTLCWIIVALNTQFDSYIIQTRLEIHLQINAHVGAPTCLRFDKSALDFFTLFILFLYIRYCNFAKNLKTEIFLRMPQ